MLNIIIFSKDRTCQLDLTLRSIKKFVKIPHKVDVLFTTSSDFYKKGYLELFIKHKDVRFWLENNFKEDTELILEKSISQNELTLFLADDEVFIRDLECDSYLEVFSENKDILGLKLYLGKNIKQRFGIGDYFEQPEFDKSNIWNIDCGLNLWRYFGSITLQIYRTDDIYYHLKKLNYSNPNSLEIVLTQNRMPDKKKLMCFDENKTALLQWNRVQNVCQATRYGAISIDYFNERWLKGEQLSLEILDNLKTDNFEFLDASIVWEKSNV